jgi:hypothetical protein
MPELTAAISDVKLEPHENELPKNDAEDVQQQQQQQQQQQYSSRRSTRLTQGHHRYTPTKGRPKRRRAGSDGLKTTTAAAGSRAYCNICDLSFGRVYDWKRHNDSVHSNAFPFPCHFCGQRFKRSDARKRHEDPLKDNGRSCCPRRTLLFESMAANADPELVFEIVLKSGLKCVNIVTCRCAAELPVP